MFSTRAFPNKRPAYRRGSREFSLFSRSCWRSRCTSLGGLLPLTAYRPEQTSRSRTPAGSTRRRIDAERERVRPVGPCAVLSPEAAAASRAGHDVAPTCVRFRPFVRGSGRNSRRAPSPPSLCSSEHGRASPLPEHVHCLLLLLRQHGKPSFERQPLPALAFPSQLFRSCYSLVAYRASCCMRRLRADSTEG